MPKRLAHSARTLLRHCRGTLSLRPGFALLLAVALAVALAASGCAGSSDSGGGPSSGEPDEPTDLQRVEIKEYEGKNLSSVEDFRENSIKGPQEVDIGTYTLAVTGLVDTPLELTYDEVLDRDQYKKLVTLNCVEGWSVDILWEGVQVADLLEQAGADPDARVIIFRAYDGYSTSLPADFIRNNGILMAYKMNGVDLPAERGFPFQLVAEEKWGYKWIKWVTEIEVSDDTSFKGFWESRGYSNDGDLGEDSRD